MGDNLLVKVYKVGFGDCIYVQIPDEPGCFTALIDCGTSGPADLLDAPLSDIRQMLPRLDGDERRLDLLVVTHPHADHIKGFSPESFKKIRIGRIWLPVFMDESHPQAKKARALQYLAGRFADDLLKRGGLTLAAGATELLKRSAWNVCNPAALDALHAGLAKDSGIEKDYPLYVARDLADRQSQRERNKYQTSFEDGSTCFRGFNESGTCLRVLAPEWDIDTWYLGQGSFDNDAFVDHFLFTTDAYTTRPEPLDPAEPGSARAEAVPRAAGRIPRNISAKDFKQLRSRLLYCGLAFSQLDDELKNNTSVVLLLEWRGRRLLFAGDAEWRGTGVKEARRNGTWDVMLKKPKVRDALLQTLDVLKVGHHGSHNGSPFADDGKEEVLTSLLSPDRTHVVVSTVNGVHGEDKPVPYPDLMRTLGDLACNRRRYPDTPEPELSGAYQPQRTDLEPLAPGEKAHCVKVTLAAKRPAGASTARTVRPLRTARRHDLPP